MKKNAMLKIAAILMVAVLLTTCAISSTFAKYTTAAKSSTSARVAQWGVTVDADVFASTPLFYDNYGAPSATTPRVIAATTGELVMAPGTEGRIDLDANIAGTPEVSGQVIVKATFTVTDAWKLAGTSTFYCPVEVKAGDDTAFTGFTSSAKTYVETLTFNFNANQSLDDAVTFPIEWKWDFLNDGELGETETGASYDAQLANNTNLDDLTLTVDLEITVVQTGSAGAHQTAAPVTPGEQG